MVSAVKFDNNSTAHFSITVSPQSTTEDAVD